MMKRIMIAVLLMMLCVVSAMAEEGLTVVATTYPLYDMAKAVCADLADVRYAPEDAQSLAGEADVVLCVGGEEEAWVDKLEGVSVIKAIDGIELIEGDTDVLTIPVNCMICASYFTDTMVAMDAINNATYQTNLAGYVESMANMDSHIRAEATEGMKVSCADGSMAYFAREYGVAYEQGADNAVELYTFNNPDAEHVEIPYVELMHENLHTLTGKD